MVELKLREVLRLTQDHTEQAELGFWAKPGILFLTSQYNPYS